MANILIIGASRGIGKATTVAALKAGHRVTAFARHTSVLGIEHQNLHLVNGDVLDISSLTNSMKNQDVVMCTLGLPTLKAIGPPFAKCSYVLSKGTANIIQAMETSRVQRLLCVTAIGTGGSDAQCTLAARLVLRYGLRWLFKEKDAQEKLIKASKLDWTVIRPSALTNGKKQGAEITNDWRIGLLTHVSRSDVAHVMLGFMDKPDTYKKALCVTYPPRFGDSLRWVVGYAGKG